MVFFIDEWISIFVYFMISTVNMLYLMQTMRSLCDSH